MGMCDICYSSNIEYQHAGVAQALCINRSCIGLYGRSKRLRLTGVYKSRLDTKFCKANSQ